MYTNKKCAWVTETEDLHLRSEHTLLCVSRRRVDGVMLEFSEKEILGWLGYNIMNFKISSLDTLFWDPRLATFDECLRVL